MSHLRRKNIFQYISAFLLWFSILVPLNILHSVLFKFFAWTTHWYNWVGVLVFVAISSAVSEWFTQTEIVRPVEAIHWSWPRLACNWKTDLRTAFGMARKTGILLGLSMIPIVVIHLFIKQGTNWVSPLRMIGVVVGVFLSVSAVTFLVLLLILTPAYLLRSAIVSDRVAIRTTPNQGIIASFRMVGVLWVAYTASSILIPYLGQKSYGTVASRTILSMFTTGVLLALMPMCGGTAAARHLVLHLILFRRGILPWRLIDFLNYCVDINIMRNVGGGYIFIHRLLMEYLAALTDEDIKRLAAETVPQH